MNAKIKPAITIPVVLLLIGTIVILDFHAYSQGAETITDIRVNIETSTQYITTEAAPVTTTLTTTQTIMQSIEAGVLQRDNIDLLVGGQNGTWFTSSQYPVLDQITLSTHFVRKLNPVPGEGTVWSGDSNGSEWLISGWGGDANTNPPDPNFSVPNPYLYLYSGASEINDAISYASESEWDGGDIFAISSNGTDWLVSGMGSGILSSYSPIPTNHLSVGLFNGTYFTDLSSELPTQMDGILYANAYNGSEWLVGGGYLAAGVLFSFNGTTFTDLSGDITSAVPSFHSVQSIAWNGQYWLIGGAGFLAKYDGSSFTNLTPALNKVLPANDKLNPYDAVNSLAWNGSTWLVGGGEQVAVDEVPTHAWVVSYNSMNFTNLTPTILPVYATSSTEQSSVLAIVPLPLQDSWVIGGYASGTGMLLSYNGITFTDLSNLIDGTTYVDWLGVD